RRGGVLQDGGEEARNDPEHPESLHPHRSYGAGSALAAWYGCIARPLSSAQGRTTRAMSAPRILLFDSGMGGLTVAQAVRAGLPAAPLIYAADNAASPYAS